MKLGLQLGRSFESKVFWEGFRSLGEAFSAATLPSLLPAGPAVSRQTVTQNPTCCGMHIEHFRG